MNPDEALEQLTYLKDLVGPTRMRLAEGYLYFLLWGAVWVIGYLGSLWLPPQWLWPAVDVLGGALSAVIGVRMGRGQPAPTLLKRLGWLSLILMVAALVLTFVAVKPDPRVINAYWPMQIGIIYLVNGLFVGRELLVIGALLIAVGLAALGMTSPVQEIWLALGGGGGLLLTGELLRRQAGKRE